MRKYYLFLIQKDFVPIYERHSMILYQTLENLFYLKEEDFRYGITLFEQLCRPFPIEVLTDYMDKRFEQKIVKKKNKYLFVHKNNEKSLLCFYNACIILFSTHNFPKVLKIFDIFSKNIFICDFKNRDYFWLHEVYHKKKTSYIR